MSLVKITLEYLNWQRSLIRKVSHLTLGYLLLGTALSTISQVLMFLAFFFPFKVIILIATPGVPRYLRFIVTPENRDIAIVAFAAASILFYLLHLFADYLAAKISHKAGVKLLAKSQKLALFNKENQLACNFFLKLCRSIGTLLMTIGGLALGLYLSSLVFGSLIGVVVLEYILLGFIWKKVDRPERLDARLRFLNKLPNLLKFLSNLNFFVAFGLLIYVFIANPQFGFIRGILSFILSRQILQRMLTLIQDSFSLHLEKPKINALFYTNIYYQPLVSHREKSFLDLMLPHNREEWLTEVVRSCGIKSEGGWRWFDVSGRNMALLASRETGSENMDIYVKIFGSNNELLCNHEKMIFDAFGKASSLVPEPMTGCTYLDFQLVIFKGPTVQDIGKSRKKQIVRQATIDMWSMKPGGSLISQFCRTKPLLQQSLTEDAVSKLFIGAESTEARKLVQDMLDSFSACIEVVSKMPLIIHNPDIYISNIAVGDDEKPMLINWCNWSLAPLMVKIFPMTKASELQEILNEVSQSRSDFKDVSPSMVLLTSHAFQLRKETTAQNFKKGIELLPGLLKHLKQC